MGRETKARLMGLTMQRAVYFFFKILMYHFGGDTYVQMEGKPIEVRLTMTVAKLVLQDWKEKLTPNLEASQIKEYLSAIHVDSGRSLRREMYLGERFIKEN